MATEQELEIEKNRTEGSRISYEFMKKHLHDYDQSERSAKFIADGLKERGLDFSVENLEKVFADLKARGVNFMSAAAPIKEEELPPLPGVPGMGDPQIFTPGDVARMPAERYKKLYFGSSSVQFRARVTEILKRAKEQK